LLRTTIPRAAVAFGSVLAPAREPTADVAAVPARPEPAEARPVKDIAVPLVPEVESEYEIEQLVGRLAAAGSAAQKVTILGTASSESISLTTLAIARQLASSAKVIVVDLAASSPTISAASVDPGAPGLADLMKGEASFTQVITKDRSSRVHLVNAGRSGADRTLLQSPRLGLAIDALLKVYDYVLLDAGSASDLPAELLTSQACAVVVPDASMMTGARSVMSNQLKAVGFSDVIMLSKPVLPLDAVDPGLRVVAA
jgi:polysaccharide biosynthesis transport protein